MASRIAFRRNGAGVNMFSPRKLRSPRVGARRSRRESVPMAAAAMMSVAVWVRLDWEAMATSTSRATNWAPGPIPMRAATLLVGLRVVPPRFLMFGRRTTCFLLSATRIRLLSSLRYFILVSTAASWVIASVNFPALRSPIAFAAAKPWRKCVFQEGDRGIVG
jgi:hypothetical protein